MSINNTNYGMSALHNNIGSKNTAFGAYAAYNNIDASNNTAIGCNSLFYNTTGVNNTALGAGSLCNNDIGSLNTAVGSSALEGLVAEQSVGNQNVAVGAQALYSNTGDLNTSIGTYAAQNVTNGSYNTFLGAYTTFDHVNNPYQNSTAIGYNAVITASNQIVLGGTGPTGYPEVIIPGGIIGPTGSFTNLYVSGVSHLNGLVYTPSGITGATGSFTNIYVSGISNLNGLVYTPNGITGATGSFNTLYVSGTSNFSGNVVGPTGSFSYLSLQSYTPTEYTDLSVVTKEYVDTVASGLKPTYAAVCATTTDITTYLTSGGIPPPTSTDGITVVNGDYVLVVNQNGPSSTLTSDVYNGLWIVNTLGAWSRPTSGFLSTNANASGASVLVKQGQIYGSKGLVEINQNAIVGTDPLQFTIFYQFGVKVGQGLNFTNNTLAVDSSLNFINYLDNVVGPNAGTLNIGTNTTNTIIGPTGGVGNPVTMPSGLDTNNANIYTGTLNSIVSTSGNATSSFYNTSGSATGSQLNIGYSANYLYSNVIGYNNSSPSTITSGWGYIGLYDASNTQLTYDCSSCYIGTFNIPKQLKDNFGIATSGTYKFMVDYTYNGSNYPVNGQVVFDIANSGGMGGSLNLSNSSGGTNAQSALSFNVDGSTAFDNNGDNEANAQILAYNENSYNSTSLRFNLWNGYTQIESMRLTPAGYVGIGTNSPAYTLDVSGNIQGVIVPINSGGSISGITNNTIAYYSPANHNFYCNNVLTAQMNTTQLIMYLPINSGENITTTGTITAASFNSTSDYRIKEDITPINNTIDNLNPIKYYNKKLEKEDMGFIAHEVQEEFPFLVSGEKDGEDMQSLNYQGLIALLVKEVQDLKRENKLVKEKLEQLENQINK